MTLFFHSEPPVWSSIEPQSHTAEDRTPPVMIFEEEDREAWIEFFSGDWQNACTSGGRACPPDIVQTRTNSISDTVRLWIKPNGSGEVLYEILDRTVSQPFTWEIFFANAERALLTFTMDYGDFIGEVQTEPILF